MVLRLFQPWPHLFSKEPDRIENLVVQRFCPLHEKQDLIHTRGSKLISENQVAVVGRDKAAGRFRRARPCRKRYAYSCLPSCSLHSSANRCRCTKSADNSTPLSRPSGLSLELAHLRLYNCPFEKVRIEASPQLDGVAKGEGMEIFFRHALLFYEFPGFF